MRNNFLCLLLFLCCVTFLSGSDESWPPETYIAEQKNAEKQILRKDKKIDSLKVSKQYTCARTLKTIAYLAQKNPRERSYFLKLIKAKLCCKNLRIKNAALEALGLFGAIADDKAAECVDLVKTFAASQCVAIQALAKIACVKKTLAPRILTFIESDDLNYLDNNRVAAYKDIALAHEFIAEECVGRLEKILINPDKDICRAATRALGIINERYKRGNINYECRRILTNLLADPECSLEAQEAFEKNGCGDDFYLKKHLKRQRTE